MVHCITAQPQGFVARQAFQARTSFEGITLAHPQLECLSFYVDSAESSELCRLLAIPALTSKVVLRVHQRGAPVFTRNETKGQRGINRKRATSVPSGAKPFPASRGPGQQILISLHPVTPTHPSQLQQEIAGILPWSLQLATPQLHLLENWLLFRELLQSVLKESFQLEARDPVLFLIQKSFCYLVWGPRMSNSLMHCGVLLASML